MKDRRAPVEEVKIVELAGTFGIAIVTWLVVGGVWRRGAAEKGSGLSPSGSGKQKAVVERARCLQQKLEGERTVWRNRVGRDDLWGTCQR